MKERRNQIVDGIPLRQPPKPKPREDVVRRKHAQGFPHFVRVDPIEVSADTAVELVLHHLSLARAYFEATPEDGGAQLREEAARIFVTDGADREAANAFIDRMTAYYDDLKARFG